MTGEDLSRFERLLEKFDLSIDRQLEVMEKLFEAEAQLANLKIGHLDEYFDSYSGGLDKVARRVSGLSDELLILDGTASKLNAGLADSLEKDTARMQQYMSIANNYNRQSMPSTPQDKKDTRTEDTLPDHARKEADLEAKNTQSKEDYADLVAKFFTQDSEARHNSRTRDNGEEDPDFVDVISNKAVEDTIKAQLDGLYESQGNRSKTLAATLAKLEAARYDRLENAELRAAELTDLRLSKQQEAAEAELKTQDLINKFNNELAYGAMERTRIGEGNRDVTEAGEVESRKVNDTERLKSLQEIEARRIAFVQKLELEARRKNNGILTEEEASAIQRLASENFSASEKNLKKLTERRTKLEAAKQSNEINNQMHEDLNTMRTAKTFEERKQALHNLTHDETGEFNKAKALKAAVMVISDFAKQLENKVDELAANKGVVDTRLQGSSHKKFAGSYWDQIQKNMMAVGSINPFFKQEDFANNIKSLIDTGIAFDIEQRAFLMTIKDKIATTFDATNGTLLRLIRIQQADSTAGRLGMEAALNAFLNEMYENTEYLKTVAVSVKSSLEEMQSLMDGAEATEVEYQVQKWLGSLYSVGMSDTAVNSISTALGQIAAGQIEGLTGGGAGNLLVMAANDAGLSIADVLTDGLDSSETNKLLKASVSYLAELASSAKDNKVVQQQLASVFGVKASDLKAATNLVSQQETINSIYNENYTYSNMLNKLFNMAGSMYQRTSIAEMMTNIWNNGQYTLASGMASTPVAYLTYKLAGLLDSTVGGIDIPLPQVMGNGFGFALNVADLMRVAAMSGGILGSIGPMLKGLGNSFSGKKMLAELGIEQGSNLTITPRGTGDATASAGGGSSSTSGSGYVGNSSGSDVKNATVQEAKDTKKKQMIEAKEEEEANEITLLNITALKIYELLDEVASGKSSFTVKVDGYGLTKASNSASGISGVNGVSALANGTKNISNSNALSFTDGTAAGTSTASGSSGGSWNSGSVELGGWSTY